MNPTDCQLLQLIALFKSFRIRFSHELEMQDDVQVCLSMSRIDYTRERIIGASRLDFLLDNGIGIECKIAQSPGTVMRQLRSYLEHDAVAGLLVVTSKAAHRVIPTTLNGKPVRVHWVAGSF